MKKSERPRWIKVEQEAAQYDMLSIEPKMSKMLRKSGRVEEFKAAMGHWCGNAS